MCQLGSQRCFHKKLTICNVVYPVSGLALLLPAIVQAVDADKGRSIKRQIDGLRRPSEGRFQMDR
jgi:hypothetical protein